MSKLDEMKEKFTQLKAQIGPKLEKIPFLKKILEPKAPKAPKPAKPTDLSNIYRTGSTKTRLQVIAMYFFLLCSLASLSFLAGKFWKKMKSSEEAEKVKKEMAHGLETLKERVEARAEMISIGSFTTNAVLEDGKPTRISIDLWAKISNPEGASFAIKNDTLLIDGAREALNELYANKISLMTEEGKKIAREKIQESMNHSMKKGKVEEVFFHNLVFE